MVFTIDKYPDIFSRGNGRGNPDLTSRLSRLSKYQGAPSSSRIDEFVLSAILLSF